MPVRPGDVCEAHVRRWALAEGSNSQISRRFRESYTMPMRPQFLASNRIK